MFEHLFNDAKILIVDDEAANVRMLERILHKEGYENLISTTDSQEAVTLVAGARPDLILLDLHMPRLDGFGVLEQLAPYVEPPRYLPVIVLTADITPDARHRALSVGARDFVGKPFDTMEVLLRIRNLLETRFLHLQLEDQNAALERRVHDRTRELEDAQREILSRLARAAEFRDDSTGQHTLRVGRMSALLAARLGLPAAQVDLMDQAAPLHDLGKIGIPDCVLLKEGRLTESELALARTHTTIGGRILAGSRFPLLQLAEQIALTHHERWDGTGYPLRLVAEQIPLPGRIVAVADVFDALTHERPYKGPWTPRAALEEIQRQSGRQFDPGVVGVFAALTAEEIDLSDPPAATEAKAARP